MILLDNYSIPELVIYRRNVQTKEVIVQSGVPSSTEPYDNSLLKTLAIDDKLLL
jgi:hypothetical protein